MKPSTPKPSNSSSENTPNEAESRRVRRRRQKQESQGAQSQAGSSKLSTSLLTENKTQDAVAGTFEEGEDFIPFGFADDSDNGETTAATSAWRDKEKGKAREITPLRERIPRREDDRVKDRSSRRDRSRDRPREDDRDRDRDRERRRDRSRDRDMERNRHRDRDRSKDRARDVDRDRPRDRGSGTHSSTKRKKDFDPNDGYINKKQRIDASSRKAPWVADLDWHKLHHVAELLHHEVEAFTNWISPSPVEDEIRGLIIALISKAVTSAFPDATVHPFGSYQTKLYLPLGDIDLVILSQSMAYSDKLTVLHALANTLKRARITERVTIIGKAKVPIVKFITTHGRFNVDISINQQNGIMSGSIINGFLRNMQGHEISEKGSLALRSLVMITKTFLGQRSMNEVFSGGLGSYSIVCLAISFLQMHPKIRRGEIDPDKNLGVLVMEFFELYGYYFNYQEVGISVRDGGSYFSKRQRGWYDYYKAGLLSIEDPADIANDISKGSFAFQKVRATFAGAYGILTSTAYLAAGILGSRRQGTSVNLRGRDRHDEELSILSSVMGVTQETINHRRLVQELYDKRVLHNIMGVKPQTVVVNDTVPVVMSTNGTSKPSPSVSQAASSVKTAWKEAEVEHEGRPHKRHRDPEPNDDDNEGRYNIGRQQPPHKRQRTGSLKDTHTVFTTDSDGSLSDYGISDGQEEAHYTSDASIIEIRGLSQPKDQEKTDKRRSFWLSKGIGIEDNGLDE